MGKKLRKEVPRGVFARDDVVGGKEISLGPIDHNVPVGESLHVRIGRIWPVNREAIGKHNTLRL